MQGFLFRDPRTEGLWGLGPNVRFHQNGKCRGLNNLSRDDISTILKYAGISELRREFLRSRFCPGTPSLYRGHKGIAQGVCKACFGALCSRRSLSVVSNSR